MEKLSDEHRVRCGVRRGAWARLATWTLALVLAVAGLSGCGGATSVAPRDYAAEVQEAATGEGAAIQQINGGVPAFTEDELAYARAHEGFEDYSALDELGRCGVAQACLGPETMPGRHEERGDISEIHPSGWQSSRYGIVEGESLYNRSHLIAWSLAAENANERNLVTGTRYMNAESMLGYENEVARYLDRTGNHVLYRVTPVFVDDELVCRGVQMEAYSLEDDGAGVSFNVFCRNIQPGIGIDYATGDNWLDYPKDTDAAQGTGASGDASGSTGGSADAEARDYVLNTGSHRFHLPSCEGVTDMDPSNREEYHGTRDELIARGYTPCGGCNP